MRGVSKGEAALRLSSFAALASQASQDEEHATRCRFLIAGTRPDITNHPFTMTPKRVIRTQDLCCVILRAPACADNAAFTMRPKRAA
ncbi:hypothetical protein [Bradyrhizobium sp.]|uniref:hypothetical protein n=1 Tax=Bradyrhizobium sp. TaxID=376 RepID=UPI0039E6222F